MGRRSSAEFAATAPADEALSPAEVFERYAPYVGRIAVRLIGAHDEVDDIVQDVFLEAFPRLGDIRVIGTLPGWLAIITTRVVARRLKRRRIRRWLGLSDMPVNVPEHAVEANAEQRVLLGQIYAVLDQFPADKRIAWALRYMEGLKLEEVAVACRCSLAAAKRRISAVQTRMNEVLGHG